MAEGGGDDDREDGGERNEPASQKRIKQAWEQGQVALSREAVGFATLLASAVSAALLMPGQLDRIAASMRGALSRSHEMTPGQAGQEWLHLFLGLVWPIAAAAAAGAVVGTLAQTRGAISTSQLIPDIGKLSPSAGFSRIFGMESGLEFLRTLLKVAIVAAALWFVASDLPGLASTFAMAPGEIFATAGRGVLRLLMGTLAAFALLTLLDVILVRYRHMERLRMSREDLKEETKESEGDPQIKGRMRQLRQALGRRRMMSAVPTATVVITNPTHYAVALSYEAGQSAAPKLVAKGVDAMAARIREAARQAGVPIVPDPPLARALYRLEVDAEIPGEHWEAVAKVIAYVMRLRGRG
ncbi:MAG: flagellar type secretion system protein FlhB [Rubritepida sp.]|nr:flagellar type secretion system protein FlhB [Rubritepida sp.]